MVLNHPLLRFSKIMLGTLGGQEQSLVCGMTFDPLSLIAP